MVLISVKAVDVKEYSDHGAGEWFGSELFNWLNDQFYDEAFSEQEKKRIVGLTNTLDNKEIHYRVNLVASKTLELEKAVNTKVMKCFPSEYVKTRYGKSGPVDWWIKNYPYADGKKWTVSNGSYVGSSVDQPKGGRPMIAIRR